MEMARFPGVLWRGLRPRHWLKNGFVAAPAVFAGHAFDPPVMLKVFWVVAGFCLASSAGYLVNDVLDREADRADPVKSKRPVASGELSVPAALGLAGALLIAALALVLPQGVPTSAALVAYLVLTLLYSVFFKTVPLLEAMVLAAGFLIRLVAGALAISVVISHWLLICGFLLALLLAFGKRVPEAGHPASRTPRYPESFQHDTVTMLAGVTLVAYTLYTVAPDTTAKIGSNALLLTVPLVLFGILRYLLLLHREGARDPTATLLADRPLLVTVMLWIALAGAIVYSAGARP